MKLAWLTVFETYKNLLKRIQFSKVILVVIISNNNEIVFAFIKEVFEKCYYIYKTIAEIATKQGI